MTKEDKELLLKDLSARLKYRVYIRHGINGKSILTGIEHIKYPKKWIIIAEGPGFYLDDIKPYLRPMSSITKEEKKELWELLKKLGMTSDVKRLDWLVAHHFDIRNLIEKGLALEAPDGMYK